MESQTSAVSTHDWVQASKGMTIVGYIDPDAPTTVDTGHPLAKESLEHTLRQLSPHITQKGEPRLDKEKPTHT